MVSLQFQLYLFHERTGTILQDGANGKTALKIIIVYKLNSTEIAHICTVHICCIILYICKYGVVCSVVFVKCVFLGEKNSSFNLRECGSGPHRFTKLPPKVPVQKYDQTY